MESRTVSLYEVLEIPPGVSDEVVRSAIPAARRRWQKRANSANLGQRQVAEQRIAAIAEAERVLLDPVARARYDQARAAEGPAAETIGEPRLVIRASGQTTSARLDLLRVVAVNQPSFDPFTPVLLPDKRPMLFQDESYLQQLTGVGAAFYYPWPGAPAQDVSPAWGNTTAFFTDQRLIIVCPNFVPPKQSSIAIDSDDSLSGMMFSAAMRGISQGSKNATAARAVAGRALATAIPWEYVVEIEVWPNSESAGAGLVFTIVGGEAMYAIGLFLPYPDLVWFRQQAEWSVRVALGRRLAVLGDGIMPSERAAVQSILNDPKPDYGQSGSLSYLLPVALDSGSVLARL